MIQQKHTFRPHTVATAIFHNNLSYPEAGFTLSFSIGPLS